MWVANRPLNPLYRNFAIREPSPQVGAAWQSLGRIRNSSSVHFKEIIMRKGTSPSIHRKFVNAQDRMIQACFNERSAEAAVRKIALAARLASK
jgi:hypothetical protein